MDLDLGDLRRANRRRQAEWPGNDKIDLAFRAIEFAGEFGEAMNLVKKLIRAERRIKGNTAEKTVLVAALMEELGDLQITLDLLAEEAGIDLAAATFLKFNATSVKHGLTTRLHEPD